MTARYRRPHRSLAFTLLELIVVLLVVGILSAIVVPTFRVVVENSRETVTRTTASSLGVAVAAMSYGDGTSPRLEDLWAVAAAEVDGVFVFSDDAFSVALQEGSSTQLSSVWFEYRFDGVVCRTELTVPEPTGSRPDIGPVTCSTDGSFSSGSSTSTTTPSTTSTTTSTTTPSPTTVSPSVVTTPGAPTGVSAIASNTRLAVSWTAPSSDGGAAITGYTATAAPGGATCTAEAPVSTCTIEGLTNGAGYTVTVTATNTVGTSVASDASTQATPQEQTSTFTYTGAAQEWVVPAGVTTVQVVARGASGGCGYDSTIEYGLGGLGGQVTTTMTVTPGETLYLYVGGSGYSARYLSGANCGGAENGWNGGGAPGRASWDSGGGGGATDIRRGGTALADRVVVAGGGGGAPDGNYSAVLTAGGFGGGSGNGNGGPGLLSGSRPNGAGATQSAGGAGGMTQMNGGSGTLGQGGNGVWLSSSGCSQISSGGGGGYYGGGGGGASCSVGVGAGGGGSSYAGATTSSTTYATASTRGNGSLDITY